MPSPKKISEFKPLITRVAQTSHYEVRFGGLRNGLSSYLKSKGVDNEFITREAGLLCSSASLPGSGLATANISSNRMGVMEKMVHAKIFNDINLEFYVDDDYKMVKFFEHWMEYATSGSNENMASEGYYYRMRFPSEYKCDQIKIIKFDRTYKTEIEYNFRKMFPISMSSIPVSYETSSVLKLSVQFNYERYIPGKTTSLNQKRGDSQNSDQTNPKPLNTFGSSGTRPVDATNYVNAINPSISLSQQESSNLNAVNPSTLNTNASEANGSGDGTVHRLF